MPSIWGKFHISALALAASFAPGAAHGAEISTYQTDDKTPFIFVIGDIEAGDAAHFRTEAAKAENAIVLLESDGGLVSEAIEIGEVIRLKGFATGVINNSVCNSSCGLIWLAGSPRGLSKSARVGFHAAYAKNGGRIAESGVANAMVGRYLTLLNLPERMVIFATSPPPDEMNWITTANYSRLGIEVRVMEDVSLASEKPAVSSPPAIIQAPIVREEVSLWANLQNWSVHVDHTLNDRCFMGSRFPDGTAIRIGYSGYSKTPYYIMLFNENWTSLRKGQEYDLKVAFDSTDEWNFPVSVVAIDNKVLALAGVFSDSSFWVDLAKSKSVEIRRGSNRVIAINLTGSLTAIESVIACQKAQNGAIAKDPFAN